MGNCHRYFDLFGTEYKSCLKHRKQLPSLRPVKFFWEGETSGSHLSYPKEPWDVIVFSSVISSMLLIKISSTEGMFGLENKNRRNEWLENWIDECKALHYSEGK